MLFALPFLPRLVARWGVVRAIAAGCVLGGAGFLALGQFQSVNAWIAIRFLMSAGLALPWLAGETWINMVTREETRGRVIAIYAISFFSGYTAGPLILDYTGLAGHCAVYRGSRGDGTRRPADHACGTSRARCLRSRSIGSGVVAALALAPVGMAGGFIGGFAEMTYLALLGNVALAGGMDQSGALRLISLLTLGGVVLQYRHRLARRQSTAYARHGGAGGAFIALSLAMPVSLCHPWAAAATAFLLGGVILGFYTLGLAIVGEEVKAADLAPANAAFLVMYQIGAIAGSGRRGHRHDIVAGPWLRADGVAGDGTCGARSRSGSTPRDAGGR